MSNLRTTQILGDDRDQRPVWRDLTRRLALTGDPLLESSLDVAVPMRIFMLESMPEGAFRETCAQWMLDALPLRFNFDVLFVKRPDQTAEAFNRLAKVLAVLAFQPDGVAFGSCRWRGSRG